MGILPKSENFANTATDWFGTHWTEMMWLLLDELSRCDTLMLHELFHRIQDKLLFAPMRNASNAHLDTLDGRYTMLLEYRALARALNASDDNERPPPSPTRCSSAPTATTSFSGQPPMKRPSK